MTKTQKWILILSPLVLGMGYVVYTLLKGGKSKVPDSYPKKDQPTDTKPVVNHNVQTSEFPLKIGSGSKVKPNKSVMTLQDMLGISIDGIFGKNTLAALQEQTGLTQINDANQLQQVLDQIYNQDNAVDYSKYTLALLNQYNYNPTLKYLNVIADTNWQQLNQRADGTFVFNGGQWWIQNGFQYDISKVIPDIEDQDTGKLILIDKTGPQDLYWLADPQAIYLS
jgi:hypothetical protein